MLYLQIKKGWTQKSEEIRPQFVTDGSDTFCRFPLDADTTQMAYYTFNKGTGINSDITVEYKVRAEAKTVIDLRFISTGSNKLGWDNKYQIIYAFMRFNENDFIFQNAARKEDNSGDVVKGYHTYKPAIGKWITVRLDIHFDSLCYDVYADGQLLAESLPFHYSTMPESE